MSRAVVYEKFGGPEVLELREVPEPHAGPGEVRVRVTAAGLNPMDWGLAARPEAAARFGITLPSGFGYDFAGVVDEVGPGVDHTAVGDRVHGGALGRAVADFVVLKASDTLFPTPDGLSDEVASTLPVAGSSAAAALAAVGLRAGDTVLIGGAAGGVGIFAVQLAKLAGATVLGTAAEGTFPFLRKLGAEPVTYGPGLADRVRELGDITAAVDLFGTETAEAALALGVPPERIATIAAGPNPPGGVRATGGADADPGALKQIAEAIVAGRLTVPVAAVFPVDRIRDAVALQAARHVHGKVVVTL
ncbi:NADPH:quinone reductase and related Zn-dependent oxidoreductase [Amycolatopsis mediterranei S699]|uniref:NADPH:quinone reductase and related Zn-dependent oxidoreductase n=4 Tax=Amycolatopsis mediterranei TaxID=33910 RepID=A0A0H3DKU4_AMYMU|nr:NADP-dependent oxidoreductase [Amycolatopsis mediterranei]ADJ50334.1 NADPH:quinone reductase and related Zn-dependent oxidoreductase [Amycolatopsis mediterranei U32]AEK47334.1 NADPH:quinone reductase and related Zn-dependent oxidoreductase [Amycolatopsis mediterranei S699]AFO82040.1 NADPH:quinone reductase and related Zn-dependent oxidoreductase [Amycolatopsis mediterranei S699]AGT89169.1 NADPH:quinone reductase-related Zn-dependent oxidoreductase [Amycolatopsis mediterranei RB]KDO08281.1 N